MMNRVLMRFFTVVILFFCSLVCAQNISFNDVFIPQLLQKTTADGKISTTVRISFPEGYYLYPDKISLVNPELASSKLSFSPTSEKQDSFFGTIAVLTGTSAEVSFIHEENPELIRLKIQGCKDGEICFPPEEWQFDSASGELITSNPRSNNFLAQKARSSVLNSNSASQASSIDTNKASEQDSQDLAPLAQNQSVNNRLLANYWRSLPLLLLLGIGVSFTACVYPLIPIVSALVIGDKKTGLRPYLLTLTYILAMATAMAILGAIFGMFEQFNLQAALQKPWVIVPIAGLFALLGLMLFDFFTLQAPLRLQNYVDRIARKQKSGQFGAAAVLGFISVLVVSPCSTPVLTALLLYSTQTSSLKGALALFVFGLGTGLPLLLFAGVLRRFMPKTGMWSLMIKRLYAWMMLALACFLLSRILPDGLSFLLWAAYFLAVAVFFDMQTKAQNHSLSLNYLLRYGAGICFIAAIICSVEVFNLSRSLSKQNFSALNEFQTIPADGVEAALRASARPSLVDFYADWCLSCKKNEKVLRNIPELQALNRIKISLNNYGTKERDLLQKLELSGPPVLLFYPPHSGLEQAKIKLIGEQDAETIRQSIRSLIEQ